LGEPRLLSYETFKNLYGLSDDSIMLKRRLLDGTPTESVPGNFTDGDRDSTPGIPTDGVRIPGIPTDLNDEVSSAEEE
jgi:hypothetical protein